MRNPLDLLAGWVQEHLLIPLLYQIGWMRWEDMAFGWALFAVYGAVQVAVTYAVCVPLERWRPVEHWPDAKAVSVDVLYTVISRVGILPLFTFVLFYQAQVALNGWMADQGWTPPMLERLAPPLLGHPVATFICYAIILDFADYWRHRVSHRFGWWWALHSLHHAQRQMTFWSDDRNHLLDDIISFVWFTAVALLIGIPPM
ncbi:MAG: sterol desaturase family protein, partial [Acetobacteraceae bacterium]